MKEECHDCKVVDSLSPNDLNTSHIELIDDDSDEDIDRTEHDVSYYEWKRTEDYGHVKKVLMTVSKEESLLKSPS